jgi:5-methylcytosine-specific restriction endonuclease McrA
MPSPKAYKRKRWERLRERKLTEDPFCQCPQCQAEGRWRLADEVDHVVPVERGGGMFDWNNLRSMSKQCHSRKTLREDVLKQPARIRGADPETGRPLDPRHYWNEQT